MNPVTTLLTATGLGALTMYLLDPETGRRRRAVARDKFIHLERKAKQAIGVTARDLRNRTLGTVAEAKSLLLQLGPEDDRAVADRVRAKLGFLVRHPSSIEVQVSGGKVTLTGPVLVDEVRQLVRGVESTRGVQAVENRLDVHESADGVPGLQGEPGKKSGRRLDLFQRRWSPTTRFLVGAACLLVLLSIDRKTLAKLGGFAGIGYLGYILFGGDSVTDSTSRPSASMTERTDAAAGWGE